MKSFKEQCIALRKKDHTIGEIMAITGRGKTAVYFHIKDISLSRRKQKEISESSKQRALNIANSRKGKPLRPFKKFKTWTPEAVLLTSHLLFDGEIGKSCVYNNRSEFLVQRFISLMKLAYDFEPKKCTNLRTGVKRVSYHNVGLGNFFSEKSQELVETIHRLPTAHQKEFLRAFFDDEGCMDFRVKENKRGIRGYQKDIKILELVSELLRNLSIESRVRQPNEVVIIGKENLIKFQKEINFSKGVRINPNRTNSVWKKDLEKRILLDMAIKSYKT